MMQLGVPATNKANEALRQMILKLQDDVKTLQVQQSKKKEQMERTDILQEQRIEAMKAQKEKKNKSSSKGASGQNHHQK